MRQRAKYGAVIVGFLIIILTICTACAGEEATVDNPSTPAQPLPEISTKLPDKTNNAGADSGSNADGDTDNNSNDDNTADTNGDSGAASGDDNTQDTEPLPLSFDVDMGISVDGQWFPIWQDASGLITALGDDYELYAAPSCVFDEGDDKEFAFDGIYVYTNPFEGKDLWYGIFLENDMLSTARDIRVGDSLSDVVTMYGDRFYWEGDTILTYSISGEEGDISSPCIQFTIEDDCVTAIEIYYPTNTI